MDISSLKRMRSAALSLASASKHLSAAAGDLGKVLLPAAANIMVKAPAMALATVDTVRNGETPEERRKAALTIGVAGLATVGVCAAVVGHFVHKHNKAKQYRAYKRQVNAAVKREKAIEEAVSSTVAVRSASSLIESAANKTDEVDFAKASGCFAIFTYDPDVENGDYSAYRDVYVGASPSMFDGALKHIEGEGNLYVHADMVYKRPVYVAFYPCEEYELFAYKEELIDVLGANESYNKIAPLAELD